MGGRYNILEDLERSILETERTRHSSGN